MSNFETMNSYDEKLEDINDYLKKLDHFFIANKVNDVDKVSTFIKFMDLRMYENLKTLLAPNEPEQTTMERTEEVLKQHYSKKKVAIAERFIFSKRDQLENETIADYVNELRKLATTCKFGAFLEEAIRDKFVFGMRDEKLQVALLKQDFTFDDAYKYALTLEMPTILQPDCIDPRKLYITENPKRSEVKREMSDFEDITYTFDVKEEFQHNGFKKEFVEPESAYFPDEPNTNLSFDADCDKEFDVLGIQAGKKEFICEYCQNVFSNNAHLRRHLRSHTGEKPYSCVTCQESFTRREGLQRHIQKSSTCEDYDKQKLRLQNINKVKQKVEHVCQYCSWVFYKKSHLKRHLRIHTGEKPYSCEICKNTFSRSEHLRKHLLIHGREHLVKLPPKPVKAVVEKKKFNCQICDQVFLKKSDLQQHLRKDSGICKTDEKIKLDGDSGTATSDLSNSGIDQDMKAMSASEVSVLFKCYICDYTTEIKNHLRGHVKIHSGIKPYLCHICDYKTTRNSYLQIHIRRHDGIKKFSCNICGFKTITQSNLKRHGKVHTGEKTLICEVCGYKTNSSSWLRVHSRIHTGEKPFACNICSYRCAERTTLRNHVRIHTGEKPFCCKFCDYRAAQRTGLTYHLKTHNKKKKIEVQAENTYTVSASQME